MVKIVEALGIPYGVVVDYDQVFVIFIQLPFTPPYNRMIAV